MKTTYSKNVRRVHSESLSNSFQTTILFLIFLSITALALSSCQNNRFNDSKKLANETVTGSKMKLSTVNRVSGPLIDN